MNSGQLYVRGLAFGMLIGILIGMAVMFAIVQSQPEPASPRGHYQTQAGGTT